MIIGIWLVLVGGLVAGIVYAFFRLSRSEARVDPDLWSKMHGFVVTDRTRAWVGTYLRTGRNLRQVCGFGGLFVAGAVTAATGLDLKLSGIIWILVGYLVGAVWAELSLTRLPLGSVRSASLERRRLHDYLAPRMLRAQVWVPAIALVIGAVAVFVRGQIVADELVTDETMGGTVTSTLPDDGALFATTMVATVLVLVTGLVVWLAQRHVVNRPQPTADAFLSAADDGLRSSSAYTLSATGTCITWLLIATQCGYLVNASFDVGRPWLALAGPAIIVCIFLAVAFFMARNTPWQVRRRAGSDTPTPTEELTWTPRRNPVPIAVGLIVLITLVGWGVRVWGPVNPSIEIYAVGGGTQPGRSVSWLELHNESHSDVELIGGTVVGGRDVNGMVAGPPQGGATITATIGTRAEITYPGEPLPTEIPAGATAVVSVSMPYGGETCQTEWTPIVPETVELTFRTSSGRTMTQTAQLSSPTPVVCPPPLPSGTPPADPEAAEAEIRAAVANAYSPSEGGSGLDYISDPTGVAETVEVAANNYPEEVNGTTATVTQISFESPEHAWYLYELSNWFGPRVGEAVLVDGQWKVARQTICNDLALANATCPPLPG